VSENKSLSYPIPWDLLFGHGPNIAKRTPVSIDEFTRSIVARMKPPPLVLGTTNLPESARFILAANHYQRKGLWILHPAAALTHAIRQHYGPGDPPVRWVVTANWPRITVGPFSFRSPGDLVLPRVAEAWSCYPVSFHGTNPAFTAKNLRRILRDLPASNRPLGLFPEGVRGSAEQVAAPLPGVERFIALLARAGVPVVPAAISESDRLVLRFGRAICPNELRSTDNSAALVLSRIRDL
jgi:1-acyl-sn-glycerol-3-phosphate acyltransferase